MSAAAVSRCRSVARLDVAHHGEHRQHAAGGVAQREEVRQVEARGSSTGGVAARCDHAPSRDGEPAHGRAGDADEVRRMRMVIDTARLPALKTTRSLAQSASSTQHRQAEQVAERRHRARLAAGQRGSSSRVAKRSLRVPTIAAQRGVVGLEVGGQHAVHEALLGPHDQRLGALAPAGCHARARPPRWCAPARARAPRRPRPPRAATPQSLAHARSGSRGSRGPQPERARSCRCARAPRAARPRAGDTRPRDSRRPACGGGSRCRRSPRGRAGR